MTNSNSLHVFLFCDMYFGTVIEYQTTGKEGPRLCEGWGSNTWPGILSLLIFVGSVITESFVQDSYTSKNRNIWL